VDPGIHEAAPAEGFASTPLATQLRAAPEPRGLSERLAVTAAVLAAVPALGTLPRVAVFQFTIPWASGELASAGPGQPGAGTSETELGSGAVAGPSASPRPFQR
jgi:hypothetical protein